jgi:hypothetical protein
MTGMGFSGEIRPLNWRPVCGSIRGGAGGFFGGSHGQLWFIGHVGGDDFVAILPAEMAEEVSVEIIKRFDAAVPAFMIPKIGPRVY